MLGAAAVRSLADDSRFVPGGSAGHYESHFIRANHPSEPRAFWIRYTVFQPEGRPQDAIGELWAIYFDANTGQCAVKEEFPLRRCSFGREGLGVRIGDALLSKAGASGRLSSGGATFSYQLTLGQGQAPILLLPAARYSGSFPKAKSVVSAPMTSFDGRLIVNGVKVDVRGWVGSRNHNWGRRHTDEYAWGQVAGFGKAPDVFLEMATARIRIGPFWSPYMTPVVVRFGAREYALNGVFSSLRRARFGYFFWDFHARDARVQLRGRFEADPASFVCLPYYNPPGGIKYCLNTKVAACRMEVEFADGERRSLATEHRAAFEILTDDASGHGLLPAFEANPLFSLPG